MGLSPFAFVIALLAAAPQVSAELAVNQQPVNQQPTSEESFQQLLLSADLPELRQACIEAASFALAERQQQLRDRLLEINPRPESIDQVLANAEACWSADREMGPGGLVAIHPQRCQRTSPLVVDVPQAADAALDHPRAALALRRLVNGNIAALEREQLQKAGTSDARPRVGVNGLDQLATLEAHAVTSFQLHRCCCPVRARALWRRVDWAELQSCWLKRIQNRPTAGTTLDQVAADQAWGLAVELLRNCVCSSLQR